MRMNRRQGRKQGAPSVLVLPLLAFLLPLLLVGIHVLGLAPILVPFLLVLILLVDTSIIDGRLCWLRRCSTLAGLEGDLLWSGDQLRHLGDGIDRRDAHRRAVPAVGSVVACGDLRSGRRFTTP